MEKKRRRGHREAEGERVTTSLGAVPLPSLTPPRKRTVSLACPATSAQPQHDGGASGSALGDAHTFLNKPSGGEPKMPTTATAMLGLGEPVRWRGNPIAAVLSPELNLGLQNEGDGSNNSAMGWILEQNLPKEAFLPKLMRAYDNVHARYTRTKARKLDIESQFEEQRRAHERFQQVADGYIQDLCNENQELKKTLDAVEKRMKWLESLYLKCQKEIRACGRGTGEVLQKADCEAGIAVSPVRPLTPTTNKLAAAGSPTQVEVHLSSELVRQPRTEEVAECRVDNSAPQVNIGNREKEEPKEIEMVQDSEGPLEIVVSPEIVATQDTAAREIVVTQDNGPQVLSQDNVELQENVVNHGNVEPSRSNSEHHLVSSLNAMNVMLTTNQDPTSPVAVPVLENSLENARCVEDSAPAELDKAIVVGPALILDCRPFSNETEFQDLYRKYVELQNSHRKELELLDQPRKEAEFQDHHHEEVELLQLHRQEAAGLLSEVEMLQKVLGHFIDMTVVSDKIARARMGKPTLILCHPLTGFRFRLEIVEELEVQVEAAKHLEFSYRNLSLGTLVRVAPWWMKEEIVFTIDQLVNFMRKFQETVTGCK